MSLREDLKRLEKAAKPHRDEYVQLCAKEGKRPLSEMEKYKKENVGGIWKGLKDLIQKKKQEIKEDDKKLKKILSEEQRALLKEQEAEHEGWDED